MKCRGAGDECRSAAQKKARRKPLLLLSQACAAASERFAAVRLAPARACCFRAASLTLARARHCLAARADASGCRAGCATCPVWKPCPWISPPGAPSSRSAAALHRSLSLHRWARHSRLLRGKRQARQPNLMAAVVARRSFISSAPCSVGRAKAGRFTPAIAPAKSLEADRRQRSGESVATQGDDAEYCGAKSDSPHFIEMVLRRT